jgi:hypothetical protein
MLDLTVESPIPLADAAKIVPPARSGKRTHLSTLLRWILVGAKAPDGSRVKLEAARLGGRWMTSREALQRFSDRLTPRPNEPDVPAPRTPGTRRRASERAGKELDSLGM